jgi:hypothetical protein
MELKVVRKDRTARSTIGELYVDGAFECFTLEDAVRPVKIKGVTAIPAGVYEVIVNWSQRFQRPLPLLLNVPNFDGVRIHAGNTDADTEGCLLVGKTKGVDVIGNSRAAFNALFEKIHQSTTREKIFIAIEQDALPSGSPSAAPAPRARSVRRGLTAVAGKRRAAKKRAGKSTRSRTA